MITDKAKIDEFLQVEHFFCDGLYTKRMTIPAGLSVGKHVHDFSHQSQLAKGTVVLDVDGELSEHTAPAYLMVEAGKEHTIIAMTDAVWFCTHITDETDPDKIDESLIG